MERKKKDAEIKIRIEKKEKDRLIEISIKEGRSLSGQIVFFLKKAIQDYLSGD